MTVLTPGIWRGLRTTSSASARFTMLAFDQRGNYVAMLPPDTPFAQAAAIKREVVVTLAPNATAVLLDPIYGLEAALALPGGCGLLLALEKTGYAGSPTAREVDFIPGWDIAKIKRLGASAVKLLVYYHPEAGAAAESIEAAVRQVAADCRQHDLPLFVEPLAYSLNPDVSTSSAEFAAQRPGIVRETARRLGSLGTTVLKLEFPVDHKHNADQAAWLAACEAVSEVSAVPWVLLSAGVDFEQFQQQVSAACKGGASGVLAGRAIWKESIALATDERADFLRTTGRDRLDRLTAIVEAHARPWTSFYDAPASYENWYEDYP